MTSGFLSAFLFVSFTRLTKSHSLKSIWSWLMIYWCMCVDQVVVFHNTKLSKPQVCRFITSMNYLCDVLLGIVKAVGRRVIDGQIVLVHLLVVLAGRREHDRPRRQVGERLVQREWRLRAERVFWGLVSEWRNWERIFPGSSVGRILT